VDTPRPTPDALPLTAPLSHLPARSASTLERQAAPRRVRNAGVRPRAQGRKRRRTARWALLALCLALLPVGWAGGVPAVQAHRALHHGAAGAPGDGGPATQAVLGNPAGLAPDNAGHLYISDYNSRVRVVNLHTGVITTVAGNGQSGDSGDGGPAAQAQLSTPEALALDNTGHLYIADSYNARVRMVDLHTGVITTVAGNGQDGASGDGGPAAHAELSFPKGLALDNAGHLYIADSYNSRVRVVNLHTGVITAVVGNGKQGDSGDGGPATHAQLNEPDSLALDHAGHLYIADFGSDRVRVVNIQTGIITAVAGIGTFGDSGDGGPAAHAQLEWPKDLALDNAGHLYIADSKNERVRVVDLHTGLITTFVGNGLSGGRGDGGPTTQAELDRPDGLALDNAGHLYIADSRNNRVRVVNLHTGVITAVAGNGHSGANGDGEPATQAQLNDPAGLALDNAGHLYIADYNDHSVHMVNLHTGLITNQAQLGGQEGLVLDNGGHLYVSDSNDHRVSVMNLHTGLITTIAGNGMSGESGDGGPAAQAQLNEPHGLALDDAGHLYIADLGNARVRVVNLHTGVITTLVGNGQQGDSGDGGPATHAQLCDPWGLAVDNAGHLYITENTRVRVVNLHTGVITTLVGNGQQGDSGDGGPATHAQLGGPAGLALDNAGHLYISDDGNSRVRVVNLQTGIITAVAGTGRAGGSGDGGPAVHAQLDGPDGLAVDNAGHLYISDDGNSRVRVVNLRTGLITTVAGQEPVPTPTYVPAPTGDGGPATQATLYGPAGLALDSAGLLYISDALNHRVRVVNLRTGLITTVVGNGKEGGSGDGGLAAHAQLAAPQGLALDNTGHLYIADDFDHRVHVVDLHTGLITTVAGNGQSGGSGDGGPATQAQLNTPDGLALDNAGYLYIADDNTNRVRVVNLHTGLITTVAGDGQSGESGDGGPAAQAELNNPHALALDNAGHLYIADAIGQRVRVVDLHTGLITTVAGNGQSGESGDGGPATQAQLNEPAGLVLDNAGHLYIADYYNRRVRVVNLHTGRITTVAGKG